MGVRHPRGLDGRIPSIVAGALMADDSTWLDANEQDALICVQADCMKKQHATIVDQGSEARVVRRGPRIPGVDGQIAW